MMQVTRKNPLIFPRQMSTYAFIAVYSDFRAPHVPIASIRVKVLKRPRAFRQTKESDD